ncbi:Autophagy-related protein 23 [Nakaseomyces glabratus]|nr:Autophagy-related protein 23 [Nakaseomyces glabratus]SLM16307.1 Autophagy-related protein 23 [Nakaseomyces glabratus]
MLNDILVEVAEKTQLLESLIIPHERALTESDYSDQLENIRAEISATLNSLSNLNDLLISHDGPLRTEISSLMASKSKLKKINMKELTLLNEQETLETLRNDSSNLESIRPGFTTQQQQSITIASSYRHELQKYLDLVDVEKTSLNTNKLADNLKISEEDQSILHSALTVNEIEIKKLETLLKEFRKDNSFIRDELKLINSNLKSHEDLISDELKQIDESRYAIMQSIGYSGRNEQQSSILDSIVKLSIKKPDIRTLIQERIEEYSNLLNFIDLKLNGLDQMLQEYKSRKSEWAEKSILWSQCLALISELEVTVRDQLSSAHTIGSEISPDQIKAQIKKFLTKLNKLLDESDLEGVVYSLVRNEVNSLNVALDEMNQMPQIKNDISDRESIHNPSFKLISKSPPKTGFSSENVSYKLNNTNIKKD